MVTRNSQKIYILAQSLVMNKVFVGGDMFFQPNDGYTGGGFPPTLAGTDYHYKR